MSNRAKIKPTRLGRAREDVMVPMVCTARTAPSAVQAAAVKLRTDVGRMLIPGKLAVRTYAGAEKVLEVLDVLAPHAGDNAEHDAHREHARELGDLAVLVVVVGKRIAPPRGDVTEGDEQA